MPWHWRHIGAPCSPRLGPVAPPEFFNFSHLPTSTPRGFHLPAGRENCPAEGETSALRPCLAISRCKCTTDKFPAATQWRSAETQGWNEEGGWGGGRRRASPPIGFKENPSHLISCPRVFKLQHKTPPGEFRQWALASSEWRGEVG